MIINRITLFFAFVFGFASTQAPEFWQQYEQRLGGAIDELAAIVSQFDTEAGAQHLNEAQAVARLEADADPLAQGRGAEMQHLIDRLARLRKAQAAFNSPNVVSKWIALVETFDPTIAARAYEAYQPAVPTTPDGFISGLIGFVLGGGLVHLIGLPIRHRKKLLGRKPQTGTAQA
ncbi:MAG: DUF2937 family protein [Pseudomonadota bacterium]